MRAKRWSLLATAASGGAMILAWSQTWFAIELTDARTVGVAGSAVGAGVLASGLAALATAAALTIAPGVLRYVLGVLALAVGVIGGAVAVMAASDPVGASIATITTETGIGGRDSAEAIIAATTVFPWPWVAVVGGILAVVAGVVILVSGHSWPVSGARYERAPVEPEAWDALTEGDDPTR